MIFHSKNSLNDDKKEERKQLRFSYILILTLFKVMCLFWFIFLVTYSLLSDDVWIFSIFSIIPPIFFLIFSFIHLFLMIIVIFRYDHTFKSITLFCVVGSIIISLNFSDILISFKNNEVQEDDYIIFNLNTEFWEDKEDIDSFYSFLKAQNADIYHLQEYMHNEEQNKLTKESLDLTLKQLQEVFPDYEIIQYGEFVTMSRLPVAEIDEELDNKYLRTDIWIDETIVSFYNVHVPVHINADLRHDYLELLKDMRERFKWRNEVFDTLKDDISKNQKPTIVTGDFNTTRSMQKMSRLTDFLHDSAYEASSPIVTSWKLKTINSWRIDYVLGNKSIMFSEYLTIDSLNFSDHLAQRVKFRLVD